MKLDIKTDYKVDKVRSNSSSLVFGYKPESSAALHNYGEMLAVLSVGSEIDFDFPNVAGWLLDELQRSYYGDEDGQAGIDEFEKSALEMRKRLEEILSREPTLAKTGIDLQAAIVVIKSEVLLAGVVGECAIFIGRDDEVNEISGALQDPAMDGFISTGSLYLKENDRILLATEKVVNQNKEDKIVDAIFDFSAKDIKIDASAVLLAGYALKDDPIVVPAHSQPQPNIKQDEDEDLPIEADVDDQLELEEEVEDLELEPEEEDNVAMAVTKAEPSISLEKSSGLDSLASKFSLDKIKEKASMPDMSGVKAKVAGYTSSAKNVIMRGNFGEKLANISKKVSPMAKKAGSVVKQQTSGLLSSMKREPGDSRLPAGNGKFSIPNLLASRWLLILAVVLVVVVGFGINNAIRQSQINRAISDIDGQITEVETTFGNLAQVNADTSNADQKQLNINNLDELKSQIITIRNQEHITDEQLATLDSLGDSIQRQQDNIAKVTEIAGSNVITNLSAQFENSSGADIAISNGNLYVVDDSRGVLYKMSTNNEAVVAEIAAGLTNPYIITDDKNGNLLVADNNEESILARINANSNELIRLVGFSRANQGEITEFDVWTNDALYAVSQSRNAIVKQDAAADSFLLPNYNSPWRNDADLASATDMQVDFWIYANVPGKGLLRFLSGEPAPYTIQGSLPDIDVGIARSTSLTITSERVLVADSQDNRIISLIKSREDENVLIYEGQYKYRGTDNVFGNIKDLVASADGNEIYVLDGNSVIKLTRAEF